MDYKIEKYLQGIDLSKIDSSIYHFPNQDLEGITMINSDISPSSSRTVGGKRTDEGTTSTQTIYEINSWKLSKDVLYEFLKYARDISGLTPKKISDTELDMVNGKTYRGTDIFLLTLACYATGTARGIVDYHVFNPNETLIAIKHVLSTPNKNDAQNFANKYIETDGKPSESFRKIENAIFQRVLRDNEQVVDNMPDFMLQPIVIGLGAHYRNDYQHKSWEGICHNPIPYGSTLNLLARLTQNEPQQFSEKYPILSSKFKG